MIKSVYTSKSLLDEIGRSPFADYFDELASKYLREGYRPANIKLPFRIIIIFMRWSAQESISPSRLRERHVDRFLADFEPLIKSSQKGYLRCFQQLLRFIERDSGALLVRREVGRHLKNMSVRSAVEDFEKYLLNERGLEPTTIYRHKATIGLFLTFVFGSRTVNLKRICAKDIKEFLHDRGKKFLPQTLVGDSSGLKCYLQYLYGKRKLKANLSGAVPKVANWRNQNLIHTITKDEMVKLLKTCDLDVPLGIRDYAVLILLMRYGLRAIEIARLELGDIRFADGKILIRGKGKKNAILPLEADVKEALQRYINYARPLSKTKSVFLRNISPHLSLSCSGATSTIVRRAIDKAGIKVKIQGARLLRYSVASSILNNGGNLREVAELLRHNSLNTTARYTRLDFEKLKLMALPWPRVSRR